MTWLFSVMAIHTRNYRISSDLRSQNGAGVVSTEVGDHSGILRAIAFAFTPFGDALRFDRSTSAFGSWRVYKLHVHHPSAACPCRWCMKSSRCPHAWRSQHLSANTDQIYLSGFNSPDLIVKSVVCFVVEKHTPICTWWQHHVAATSFMRGPHESVHAHETCLILHTTFHCLPQVTI